MSGRTIAQRSLLRRRRLKTTCNTVVTTANKQRMARHRISGHSGPKSRKTPESLDCRPGMRFGLKCSGIASPHKGDFFNGQQSFVSGVLARRRISANPTCEITDVDAPAYLITAVQHRRSADDCPAAASAVTGVITTSTTSPPRLELNDANKQHGHDHA